MNLLDAMRYLTVLEQHRHFGRAASACHITQPALSNALRALEEELGVALVRRSRQYEGLTAEGEVVLAHAHRLLHGVEGLRQELASLAGAPRGVLRLGAVPTAVPVAARFAARLRARHPGIRPVLQSLSSQAIEAGLDSLALDLALGYSERPDVAERGLQVLAQYGERYFLVERGAEAPSPAAGGLRLGTPCSWPEVAERALVMLTPEMHNRRIVEAALAEAGAQAHPVLETDSVLALLQAVLDEGEGTHAGELAAVLPGALVDTLRHQPGLLIRPLAGPLVETPIGWMSSGSAPPSRVLEAALAFAAEPAWRAQLRRHTGLLDAG